MIVALNQEVQAVHAALIPELFKPFGPATLGEPEIRRLLDAPENIILLAVAAVAPTGYLYAEVRQRDENAYRYAYDEIYVHHLSVQPLYQRHGVGSALIDAIGGIGRELGIARLALDVWTANASAALFFRKHGFAPYNERLARGAWGTMDRVAPGISSLLPRMEVI